MIGHEPTDAARRVVLYKLGGSLLDFPNLADRIETLLSSMREEGALPLIVVGGGSAAELVRQWDTCHRLGEERAHGLALRAMMLNESLLLELLPRSSRVSSREEACQVWERGGIPVLCADEFLKREENPHNRTEAEAPLPHTWDVTSDSIAAWIAARWPADDLIFLKSASFPANGSVRAAAEERLIDPFVQNLLSRFDRIGWINLRESSQVGSVQWHDLR